MGVINTNNLPHLLIISHGFCYDFVISFSKLAHFGNLIIAFVTVLFVEQITFFSQSLCCYILFPICLYWEYRK